MSRRSPSRWFRDADRAGSPGDGPKSTRFRFPCGPCNCLRRSRALHPSRDSNGCTARESRVVPVERSGTEGADDEVVSLEGLVHRRWLVELAGDRREVVHVEAVGVVAAIPADDVERVIGVVVAVHAVAGLDADFEGTLLIEGEWKLRKPQVSLAIRRVLEELAGLLRDVPRGREDVGAVGRFEDDELRVRFLLGRLVEDHPIDGPLGDDDVVLGAEGQRSELAVQRAGAVVDEKALVTLAVLVVVVHRFRRHADRHFDVGVAHDHDASGDGVTLRRHRRGREMTHSHRLGLDVFRLRAVEGLPARHLCRRVNVVDRRGRSHEAFGAEDLFRVERAVGAAELNMTLARDLAEGRVVGHDRCFLARSERWGDGHSSRSPWEARLPIGDFGPPAMALGVLEVRGGSWNTGVSGTLSAHPVTLEDPSNGPSLSDRFDPAGSRQR